MAMMKFLSKESTIFFDVDDTLVMHDPDLPDIGKIDIVDPYDATLIFTLTPHKRHVKLLKDKHARGYGVVVWSAGGAAWANAVVNALHLTEYVDLVCAKPNAYVDDVKCEDFIGPRIYLEDKKNVQK